MQMLLAILSKQELPVDLYQGKYDNHGSIYLMAKKLEIIPLFMAFLVLTLSACRQASGDSPEQVMGALETSVPTLTAKVEIPPTPLASVAPTTTLSDSETNTPFASSTPLATVEPTVIKETQNPTKPVSPTMKATEELVPVATLTELALSDPVDRTCPDPPPGKPDYDHYYLSSSVWPVPEQAAESHFWLAKPLPGGGRLLYTEWLPYGYDAGGRYLLHNGIDAAEPQGTPLLAVDDGLVVVAGDDYTRLYGWRCDWYGNLVVIELDRRWRGQPVYIVYGHVLEIEVEMGQRVKRGQKVAEVGVGGAAKLPHLHFEVRVGTNEFGSTRNPLLWLEPSTTRGIIAGRLVDPEGRPWQGVTVSAVAISDEAENKTTWTYLDDPQHLIGPDEVLAENFVIGDLKPGQYDVYVALQGETYRQVVQVKAGELTIVDIVTVPYKTSTPAPIGTEVATPTLESTKTSS